MYQLGFLKVALVFAHIVSVLALSNTSPFVLLSNKKSLQVSESLAASIEDPQNTSIDKIIAESIEKCVYDSYIFVHFPNAKSNKFNQQDMPFLSEAISKSADYLLRANAKSQTSKEEEVSNKFVKQYLTSDCEATPVEISIDDASSISNKDLFTPYEDTKPRVFLIDFASGFSVQDLDEVIRKVIGHLPSANFLLSVRTSSSNSAVQEAINEADKQKEEDEEEESSSDNDFVTPGEYGQQSASYSDDDKEDDEDKDAPYESLFKNYQFFSPALFMSLMVSGLLIFVFLIALKSVGSLQISTAAFEPQQQNTKKQQ